MKKRIFDILKIVIICVLIEVIFFNITSYISIFRGGKKIEYKIGKNEDFIEFEDKKILAIPLKNINEKVNSIALNISNDFSEEFEYNFAYSDETSQEMLWLQNSKTYIKGIEKSKYINTFLSGKVDTIWFITDKNVIKNGQIESIILNEKIPLEFDFVRFLVILGIGVFLYAMKNVPKEYDKKNLEQEIILIFIVVAAIIVITFLNILSGAHEEDVYSKDFLNAIKSGQVHLERKDSEKLSLLDNPYDNLERDSKLERGTDYLWDVAYYNGNYYVYFGIVPILTLFLPFNLITHKLLTSSLAVLVYSILTCILLKEIVIKLVNKFFDNISFKVVASSIAILCFGSMILFLNGIPRFYETVIIAGLYFSLQGIYFILKAIEKENKVLYKYIFIGSLFLALSVGCRPTFLLVSLLVLPLFIRIFINGLKEKNYKEIVKEILSVAIPYLSVGVSLMYYNYIRFGNIFEFGAKYQLTISNMTALGSRMYAIPKGLWCNLFSMPVFTGEFPFLDNHNNFNFNGYYYIENMIGGAFMLAPICFFNFSIVKIFKKIENKRLRTLIINLITVASIIAILSICMAGSNQRYLTDYTWMFIISSILIFMCIYTNLKSEESRKILEKIICIIAVYTIIINIAAGIISEKSYIKHNSSKEFNKLKYRVCFWE